MAVSSVCCAWIKRADRRRLQRRDAGGGCRHRGVAQIELGALDLGFGKLTLARAWSRWERSASELHVARDAAAEEFLDPVEILLGLAERRLRLLQLRLRPVQGDLIGGRIDPEQDLTLCDACALLEFALEQEAADPRAHLDVAEAGDPAGDIPPGYGTSAGWATMMPTSGGGWAERDAVGGAVGSSERSRKK